MNQFSQIEIANWIAIYLAAGMCCAIAMVLSVSVTLHGLWQDRAWQDVRNIRGAFLSLPKAWWKWQKLYLLSTPVTLIIVIYFAATMT
jgi:hypothetical protein